MISVSTTKSSSNWLDRLRSTRGFPTGEEPGLDRFLATFSSSSGSASTAEPAHSDSTQLQPAVRPQNSDEKWVGEVSNVLCELFIMGEETSRSFSKNDKLKKKKSSRKQANPRFCSSSENELCSSDDLRREKSSSENGLASSGDNSNNNNNNNNGVEEDEKLVEGEDFDLKEYSRSEVTVIDTSFSEWKFDRWIFRKNDEWKIKEKKSKSRVFSGKKRKLLVNENLDEDQKKKMKNKVEESLMQLNKAQPQNDKEKEPLKVTANFLGKAPKKRFPCPRPPEKPRIEGSSVILLKSIPLTTNNAATKLGKTTHKKRPKQMKIV